MFVTENEDNEKLLYAKIEDKIKLSKTRNKIMYTDFLYETEIVKSEKYLKSKKINTYIFFGGYEEAERKSLIIYPEKLNEDMVRDNYNNIFSAIRIELPSNIKGTYSHKEFLGGIMKLGIAREKIGDIIIDKDGADIIIFRENEKYLLENLKLLTRFKKSKLDIIEINNLKRKENKFEDISVIVSSMRIDNFISELARTSRNKADELIEYGRILINHEEVFKSSKIVKENDIITIRGKGKFIVENIIRNTKNGRLVVNVKKYV